MAKIFGTHTCSNCKENFSWDYHVPNRMSDRHFDVEPIIPENVHATKISSIYSKTLELRVKCKYCNQLDTFVYNDEQ